jgi:hypothetical protein
LVDELFSVAVGTEALGKRVSLDLESTKGRREFEGPEEVICFLELGTAGCDFVDQVLHAADSNFAELTSDDAVVSKRNSASVHLSVTTLINKTRNGVTGWITESNVGLDPLDHVPGCLVQLNKNTVVELTKTQKLENLSGFRSKLVYTEK